MLKRALFLAVAFATPAAADTAVRAGPARDVVVTIYRDNLALITETRDVTLPADGGQIEFPGVLEGAISESAVLRGLEGRERERNFDFDGLTPSSLVAKSIGADVRVVRTHERTGKAVEEPATIAAAGNGVALQFKDRLEALGCAGFPEKLVLSKIPEGLKERPTLSTTIAAGTAETRAVTLSYLATGLSWQANYVVTERGAGAPIAVEAWVTLTNQGAEGFDDAQVGVVAGELNRVFSEPTRALVRQVASRACWPTGTTTDNLRGGWAIPPPPPPPPPPPMAMAAPMPEMAMRDAMREEIVVTASRVAREELADYQFYRLAGRTTLNPRQTKQVRFLAKASAIGERLYRGEIDSFINAQSPHSLGIILRFQNNEANGLGDPLPKGPARLFAPFRGQTLFLAETEAERDTAIGLKWELEVGESPSVTAQARIVSEDSRNLRGKRSRATETRETRLANALAIPVTVELAEAVRGPGQRISGETTRHVMKDGQPTWTLTVPANGDVTLRYQISWINQ